MKKRYEYLILWRREFPNDVTQAALYRWDSVENRIYTYSRTEGIWHDNFPYEEHAWRNLIVVYDDKYHNTYVGDANQCRVKRVIRGINPALVAKE